MVERICPQCQHGNPLDNRFCGQCGAALERNLPAPREQTTAITLAGVNLPVQAKQIGSALAVSLVALVAEAGMAWLKRRLDQAGTAPSPTVTVAPAATTQLVRQPQPQPAQPQPGVVTIFSQRIVEVWEHGDLTRQTIERSIWRREE